MQATYGCQKRYSAFNESVFQGLKGSLGSYILVLYLWAHRTPFNAMTGMVNTTLSKIQLLLRKKMKTVVEAVRLGGVGDVVEIDETEYGKKNKGSLRTPIHH